MTATINTVNTQSVNPFITHHNCWLQGFWFQNADGENQVIYPQYLHNEQKVVCKVDGEDTTFTMFSTVGMTPREIAEYYIDCVNGYYCGKWEDRKARYKGVRSLLDRCEDRHSAFKKALETATGGRTTANRDSSLKRIVEDVDYTDGDLPSFSKVKGADLSDYWYPTNRYGDAGASDESTVSVHQVKGGSDHKIVTMTYYNYYTDKSIKRFLVVDGDSALISEHTTMKDAKHKVALLEWNKAHSA